MLFLIGNLYRPLNKIRILVGYTEHPISNRDSDTKCDSDRHLHGKLTLPSNASSLHGKVVIFIDSFEINHAKMVTDTQSDRLKRISSFV